MKRIKKYIFIWVLTLNFCYGQNISQLSLSEIIASIERQYDVKFSYAFKDVADVVIEKPSTDLSLQEIINYLNKHTLLSFKILDDRYVTVSKFGKTVSVCGTVFSFVDKKPLMGASVFISATDIGGITDESGKFQLERVPVNAMVTISYLGFKSKVVEAKQFFLQDTGCKTIFLEADSQILSEVVVTKFLTSGLQKLVDGSTVLNTNRFGILPGLTDPDVLQSIQALPGVESVNESIANINVRGGTNDQNLMLWDGIKMYHSGHFFGLISAYNPNLTNKVIVTKNGTSSEFSDGVSSTIDMRTKDELTRRFSGGFGANLISGDAFLEIPVSKQLELHVSARRSFTDAYKTFTYDKYFDRSFQDSDIRTTEESQENENTASDFMFYDYTAKLLYDLNDNHKFRVNVIGINNNLEYSESITDASNETESKSSVLSQENIGVGGYWKANWRDKFSTQFNAYYSKYNVDAEDYTVESNQLLSQHNEVLETGFKLNTHYQIHKTLDFLNGYQFNETGILNETVVSNPSYFRTKKDVLLNHAFYSQMAWHKENTFVRAGVRINYFQKFNTFLVEPRINIRQKLLGRLDLKLEGEFKNQSATQIVDFEDDFLGVEKRRWILANQQDIPISKSKQASLGLELNKNNLNISATGFFKTVQGITASNQGFYNNFQYVKAIGEYRVKGLEFLANKTAKTYSTWMSYTYSQNDYKFKTFEPSEFPNNVDIRHSVSLAFNYDVLKDLKVSIGGIWRSGHPYTKPVEGNETVESGNRIFVNYDTPNAENLEDFKRLDVSLSYKFVVSQSVKASLKAGVLNLTNSKNIINRYYKVNPNDSNAAVEVNNTSLPFTPNVSFRFTF